MSKKIESPLLSAAVHDAKIILSTGFELTGKTFGYDIPADGYVIGEMCFTTSLVGYTETITDPSFKGQMVVFTYPMLGNYGVPEQSSTKDHNGNKYSFESSQVQCSAVICQWANPQTPSHAESTQSISDWLREQKTPGLFGVDTRALTQHLRDVKGTVIGRIEALNTKDDNVFVQKFKKISIPNLQWKENSDKLLWDTGRFDYNLVKSVSCNEPYTLKSLKNDPEQPETNVLCVDLGMKTNIIRLLLNEPNVNLKLVPWDYAFDKEIGNFNGLFLSNGPGDPTFIDCVVKRLRACFEDPIAARTAIFGICLGHQIIALASGAKTRKMELGHRGSNHPVMDLRTGKAYITSQNHGYEVVESSLNDSWTPTFTNINDGSNEGISHMTMPWSSVQFHPEAACGPTDTSFLLKEFVLKCRDVTYTKRRVRKFHVPLQPKKCLIIGSGGLTVGQAGEFDYSGSQAIKALKEENVKTVLINPNIATVQTSPGMADTVYFLPITPEFVKEVILKECPDSILVAFGGQTALNCAVELYQCGFLEEQNVRVLGTDIETIIATEDRDVFSAKMAEIGEKCATSCCANNIEEALQAVEQVGGYPVLLRSAFSLGGLGSGFANNEKELKQLCNEALATSPQVIIDKSLKGWKELEYEVVRDVFGNVVTVCNMENFDPLGVHTGDSIVVAPSQTLNNRQYHMLRDVSCRVIGHLGIVGECNIQFALHPETDEYCIVEVNARLSRSSALASKATGYPLAYVAAKLALHKDLPSMRNKVTGATTACFEPALDYCVVKIPRFDLVKFNDATNRLGSAMKSVGEIMAIGRSFPEAFQKGLRMITEGDSCGFGDHPLDRFFKSSYTKLNSENYESNDKNNQVDMINKSKIIEELRNPTPFRVWVLYKALQVFTVEEIHEYSSIDLYFLRELKVILEIRESLRGRTLTSLSAAEIYLAKSNGISDEDISHLTQSSFDFTRVYRKSLGIKPCIKTIDTTGGETPAKTNYQYLTYHGTESDLVALRSSEDKKPVVVLGCGGYRIGSSVEFDWSAMSAVKTIRESGHPTIVINCNPETVTTDFDESDRLYFEEIALETVLDIYEFENEIKGFVISVGGQVAQNLAIPMSLRKLPILGTKPENIDVCENRNKFSNLIDKLGIYQPAWTLVSDMESVYDFCDKVGYPVLARPSYVLSGAAMMVCETKEILALFLQDIEISQDKPLVLSKYLVNCKEVEFDAIADRGTIINYAVSEHIENAGVHSGDATMMLPAQKMYCETFNRVRRQAEKIAKFLEITGPFNIQFMAKENDVMVIECNLRASRSFPMISKAFRFNFISAATKIMLGEHVKPFQISYNDIDSVCCKSPMFSFTRLRGADPRLGVEMRSTGEVACFGRHKHESFLKSWIASNNRLPKKNVYLSVGTISDKNDLFKLAGHLCNLDLQYYGSPGTIDFLKSNIDCNSMKERFHVVNKEGLDKMLTEGTIDLGIMTPRTLHFNPESQGFKNRRKFVDLNIPLITNMKLAECLVHSLDRKLQREKAGKIFWGIEPWDAYANSRFN